MALMKFLMKLDVTPGLVDIWKVSDTVFSLGPFLWSGTKLDKMLAPCRLTACQGTSWPSLLHPLRPLPQLLLPSTAGCLESKSQGNPQVHFFEILEGGSGGAVSGWHLNLVCIQTISSEQDPHSAEIPWLAFVRMSFESSHTPQCLNY